MNEELRMKCDSLKAGWKRNRRELDRLRDESIEVARTLRQAGWSYQAIAEELGSYPNQIGRWVGHGSRY